MEQIPISRGENCDPGPGALVRLRIGRIASGRPFSLLGARVLWDGVCGPNNGWRDGARVQGMAICTARIAPSLPLFQLTRSGRYDPSDKEEGDNAYCADPR